MNKTFSNKVGDLLGAKLEGLESASLRHGKLLFLGDNNQKEQLHAVAETANRFNREAVNIPSDASFELKLGGRMMVNISTGVLENAGLALHRHYNCPYIPGSALKGIARHQAWCEWSAAATSNKEEIAKLSARVFGSSVDEDTKLDHEQGIIAFMDAFPNGKAWSLVVDVLTPHGGNDYANPIPCFFLAVESGVEFRFSLNGLRDSTESDIKQAQEWLCRGLMGHGVGAKTIAGYGWFYDSKEVVSGHLVQLVSPGFLGGGDHEAENDTRLRPSSLRGLLRWWWRTLYRDLLDEKKLKEVENLLWGSTDASGLIRVRVVSKSKEAIERFDFKERFDPKPEFAREHNIDTRNHGLHYMAYGMDEKTRGVERKRYFANPGASWNIIFSVRNAGAGSDASLSIGDILSQADAALSLLCCYGGIGSKSRKGFGSIQWNDALDLNQCRKIAEALCGKLRIKTTISSAPYSWSTAVQGAVEVPCSDAWTVMDRLGLAVKSFAAEYKHQKEKAALGLPRKIHGPRNEPLPHQSRGTHQRPSDLIPLLREAQNGQKTRFAAPIWYHLEQSANGKMMVRIVAFPSNLLTRQDVSERMLGELVRHVEASLKNATWQMVSLPRTHGRSAQRPQRFQQQNQRPAVGNGLSAGKEVRVLLLEEKTKKGGWKVCPVGTQLSGAVTNTNDIPGDKKAGEEILVVVNCANPPSYRYKK